MKNVGLWIGLVLLMFAGTIFWQSLSLNYYSDVGPGPGLFPLWLSGILGLLAVAYMVDSIRSAGVTFEDVLPLGRGGKRLVALLGAVVLFVLLAPYAGFTLAGIIMLWLVLAAEYRWYRALAIATVVSVATFLLFKAFLGVPLPVNRFGW